MKIILFRILLLVSIVAALNPSPALSAANREQELREAVTAFITGRNAGMGWDVTVKRMTISDSLKLPDGKVEYDISAPQQWEGWGNTTLAVILRQNDRVVRNIPVRVDVAAVTDMVVALHQIEHGALLDAGDVVLQKREISQSSHLAARALSDVIGKRARTTVKANHPIRTDLVERVPLVKPGQMVTIIAENELMKISVVGKARSAGAEGDTIRVQNSASLKEISARVISATTVQVAF